ncbi:MAG: hypothetical protein R3F02_02770 [Thiolinea sp.]
MTFSNLPLRQLGICIVTPISLLSLSDLQAEEWTPPQECTAKFEGIDVFKNKKVTPKDLNTEQCVSGTDPCTVGKALASVQSGNSGSRKKNLPSFNNQCAKAMVRCLRARAVGIVRIGGFAERCIKQPNVKKPNGNKYNKFEWYEKTNGKCDKGAGGPSDHATGDAVDLFNSQWKPPRDENKGYTAKKPNHEQTQTGDRMVEWLKAHGDTYGVKYFVWNKRRWEKVNNTWKEFPNGLPHYDHVHVSFKKNCPL